LNTIKEALDILDQGIGVDYIILEDWLIARRAPAAAGVSGEL